MGEAQIGGLESVIRSVNELELHRPKELHYRNHELDILFPCCSRRTMEKFNTCPRPGLPLSRLGASCQLN